MLRSEAVAKLMVLFAGSKVGYGQFIPSSNKSAQKVSGTFKTIAGEPPTEKQWMAHLDGTVQLGIAPVASDGSCIFSAMDVDYDVGVGPDELMSRKWSNMAGCPLVPVTSKGGGLHLYRFHHRRQASVARSLLLCDAIDMRLNMMKVDIFPRTVANLPDQVGSWILMPYFGGEGGPLSLEDFILAAEMQVTRTLP